VACHREGFLQLCPFLDSLICAETQLTDQRCNRSGSRSHRDTFGIYPGTLEVPREDRLELLIDLPVVLPPSVAGLALLIAFGRTGVFGAWLNTIGITLPFTTVAVVMAQTFCFGAIIRRLSTRGLCGIMNKSRKQPSWRVPMNGRFFVILCFRWRAGILAGLILTWARALGEFGATILFCRPTLKEKPRPCPWPFTWV